MKPWSTHLRNQVTAAIDHAIAAGKWHHKIAAEVEATVAAHEAACRFCADPEPILPPVKPSSESPC